MKKAETGFTIVELLVVVVVIAILAAISMVAYSGMQQRARDGLRKQVISDLVKSLELYKINNGDYITVGGGAGDGTGWVNSGSPWINTTIKNANIVANASMFRDPNCLTNEVSGCSGFIKVRCDNGDGGAIIARLEGEPTGQPVPLALSTCANTGWWSQFNMNYFVKYGG